MRCLREVLGVYLYMLPVRCLFLMLLTDKACFQSDAYV